MPAAAVLKAEGTTPPVAAELLANVAANDRIAAAAAASGLFPAPVPADEFVELILAKEAASICFPFAFCFAVLLCTKIYNGSVPKRKRHKIRPQTNDREIPNVRSFVTRWKDFDAPLAVWLSQTRQKMPAYDRNERFEFLRFGGLFLFIWLNLL